MHEVPATPCHPCHPPATPCHPLPPPSCAFICSTSAIHCSIIIIQPFSPHFTLSKSCSVSFRKSFKGRGGEIVSRRSKGGGMNSLAYIYILLGLSFKGGGGGWGGGGSKDSRGGECPPPPTPPPPPPPPPKKPWDHASK